MTELNNETFELSFDELEQVSGGRNMIDMAVDAYLAALGARLMAAIQMPRPTMSLHMR
jgi:hypothetical protein